MIELVARISGDRLITVVSSSVSQRYRPVRLPFGLISDSRVAKVTYHLPKMLF